LSPKKAIRVFDENKDAAARRLQFKLSEIKMKANVQKLSDTIAEAIVDLVNAVDGPVTLLKVDREVPGFAQSHLPAWCFTLPGASRDGFVWGGMTEAGEAALRKIIYRKKVAIQFVTPQPYLLDGGGCYLDRDDWQAIMLLPARAANMSTPDFLARLSQKCLEDAGRPSEKRAAMQLLRPGPLRFSADYFSIGDPRNSFSALLVRATAA
jgi:hypothetical protein